MDQIPLGTAAAVFLGTLPLLAMMAWNLIDVRSLRQELVSIRQELTSIRGEINQIWKELALIRERLATLEERDRLHT